LDVCAKKNPVSITLRDKKQVKSCPMCQATYPSNFTVCPQDATPLIDVGAWAEGAVVRGKYRVLCKIGQGGMGAVYKAQHVRFEELRALKVISAELATDPSFVKRFIHEAVITRKLHHPNAVLVDDVDEAEDGRPFIVMEFMEGQSLKSLIRKEAPLPVARVCSIIQQAAAALGAAHTLGMVHRDIKPDNIFLVQGVEGEKVKVLDFGIAKVKEASLDSASGVTKTKTGLIVGTPQYMSPEQAMGMRGDELDGRSDLYSLGVVMYEMLCGNAPFQADTTMKILMAHIHDPPPPVGAAHPELDIPEGAASVVMRLLEKKRENRPTTAADLIKEIEGSLEAFSAPLPATRVARPSETETANDVGRRAEHSQPIPPPSVSHPRAQSAPPKAPQAVQPPTALDASDTSSLPQPQSTATTPLPPAPIESASVVEGYRTEPSSLPEYRQTLSPKPPNAVTTPQFRTVSEPPSRLRFILPAVLTLAAIIAVISFRNWPTNLNKGISMYRSSQYAAAAIQFQKAVGENSDLVTGWLYLGASYARQWYIDVKTDENQKLASKATDAFKGALEIEPKNKVALAGLSYIFRGEGNGETALEYEREFNEVEPENIFHADMLGSLDLQVCRGRIEDFAIKLGVPDLYSWYNRLNETAREGLAEKLEAQNNGPLVDEGMKALSKAIQINPNDPEIMQDLYQMYLLRAILDRDDRARSNDLKVAGEFYSKSMAAKKAGKRSVMDPPPPKLPGSSPTSEDDFSFLMGFPQTSAGYIAAPPPPPPPPFIMRGRN
jgi:serine/threonine protein kinase